jgi:transcriptional regulator with XRE-family HTH domain
LRLALRAAREQASKTQKMVADELYWSVSKIVRIEQGTVPVAPSDVRLLLHVYGIVDTAHVADMVSLAQAARARDQWARFKDYITAEAIALFANEQAAQVIMKYEPDLVPGLLQTEDYARALLHGQGATPESIERQIEARILRQGLLGQPDQPRLDFILGEASLSRPIGGVDVMRRQIEQLNEMSERLGVTLQLLPFDAGPHPGMGSPFTILQFGDPYLPDFVYLEAPDHQAIERDDLDVVQKYLSRFANLKDLAAPADEFGSRVDAIVAARFDSRSAAAAPPSV